MISLHYSNYKSYLDIHVESILEYCNLPASRVYKTAKLDDLVKLYFGTIITDFESLLRATPDTLKKIKDVFDALPSATQTNVKNTFKVKGLYDYFNKDVFKNKRLGISYGSRYLSDKLDVFTCPYCNENFIYYFNYKGGTSTIRRTFDWDHIYSQNDYPFLAISFFNLTPCCKVCNQIKLDKNLNYFNPHIDVDVNSVYFFHLNPIGAGFITDGSKIQLNIVYKKRNFKDEIKITADAIGLLSRMRCHKEIVKDLLNRQRMYPNPYLQSVAGQMSGLNSGVTPAQLRRTLYGTHFNHQDYFKRPFSKLTDDILKHSQI
ncbi:MULTISPECIES: hypothetical protein [unclassified Flavobacterium]|uniref:hypothetical protein n=1 Tax=unclassified Flavobacterium TaxID=196869 RepID=UPI003F90076A